MHFDAITLFPGMFESFTGSGIVSRAFKKQLCHFQAWNPRDFVEDVHKTVDDRPYGGGPGMVMLSAPLEMAVMAAKEKQRQSGVEKSHVVYMSPQGKVLNQDVVNDLLTKQGIILIAGRYEGVDERFIQRQVDEEISIGDYVLSGGELPAMVLMDAVIRHLPGVLNDKQSAVEDSFFSGLLDCPHYTRPEVYEGMKVPDVLLSGNHKEINRWRLKQALGRTWLRRPELLAKRALTKTESGLLTEFQAETK
ncbi:tRNA (guanosine(37)-N1)-methyltransferase TrmD [Leeia sp. TBRC 13508]|uniref:tRNA (guanine-N(1)-)-methyltransferase n=1 Tax=Leeia speluncae TaxID=2884804 RepID=A0ABS8D607_9NEIS|nr:tRNA (guanosine(37)-N1)-methyltransferase TrmD [Leeia speluncae]MCB6183646.1 tRNA (guanosine(37)-N1)-methyltransferase TrmD [Leeia speluncae]